MKQTRSDDPFFSPVNDRYLNRYFKALSNQTRRGILSLLLESERSVGEIVGNFRLSQPTISRHLSVLKEAHLVIDRRQGQNVIYRICEDTLTRIAGRYFNAFEPDASPRVRSLEHLETGRPTSVISMAR